MKEGKKNLVWVTQFEEQWNLVNETRDNEVEGLFTRIPHTFNIFVEAHIKNSDFRFENY